MRNLSVAEFYRIADFAKSATGIVFDPPKLPLVQARLSRHVKKCGFDDYTSFLDALGSDNVHGQEQVVSLLTTNMTCFFREPHHFEILRTKIVPQLKAKAADGNSVRVWSAGCSTGHEAFSVAMATEPVSGQDKSFDYKILATDIDRRALERAIAAKFPWAEQEAIPTDFKHNIRKIDGLKEDFSIRKEIQNLITFKKLNLFDPWPMKRKFDVIFCRNVLIYFSDQSQENLLERMTETLELGGWLFLGHSERLPDHLRPKFRSIGITAYQKTHH